jgi:DNA-directed RNA polymerase subunit RPC12/RpoP
MTEVTCHNCGHSWDTDSTLEKVTCPSCNYKTTRDGDTQ